MPWTGSLSRPSRSSCPLSFAHGPDSEVEQPELLAGRRLESFEWPVRVQVAVAPDVENGCPALAERPRHPDTPMTLSRIFLGAQQADGLGSSARHQPLDAALKPRCCCHLLVRSKSLCQGYDLAKLSSTKLLPHEEVPEPGVRYNGLEVLAVELVGEARIRLRAHVDQDGDAVLPEQGDQPICMVVRVADGQDARRPWTEVHVYGCAVATRLRHQGGRVP
jgi:hypothetical protein